jgi:hypothetical protein
VPEAVICLQYLVRLIIDFRINCTDLFVFGEGPVRLTVSALVTFEASARRGWLRSSVYLVPFCRIVIRQRPMSKQRSLSIIN